MNLMDTIPNQLILLSFLKPKMMHENKEVRKLELCDIAPYLQYGLLCNVMGESMIDDDEKPAVFKLVGLNKDFAEVDNINPVIHTDVAKEVHHADLFPLLHPLSMLTQEITHNGETFIPIVRLLRIEYKIKDNSVLVWNGDYIIHKWGEKPSEKELLANIEKWKLSYEQFQLLASWHFDFQPKSLIQSGLAIPIQISK